MLEMSLQADGYDVLCADDGRTAIDLAHEARPDVILMDLGLPRMSGADATRHLKADSATRDIPIIMLTGQTRRDDLLAGLRDGADEYVTKPFDLVELLARVRSVCRLEHARRDVVASNVHLAQQVSNKTRRLAVLYRFARSLNETATQGDILQRAIDAVREASGAQRVSVMLPEADGQFLICARALGIPPQVTSSVRVRPGEGVAGRVFSTGRTIVADNAAPDESSERGYTSDAYLSAPLISTSLMTQDEVLGVLNATDKPDLAPFDSEDVECITSIADMTAVALHNQLRRAKLDEFMKVLLWTIGHLAEYRDDQTARHLERVQRYAHLLATELQYMPKYRHVITDAFIEDLTLTTPLHDIGKVGIPDEVLKKRGALTPEELAIMRTHVDIGRRTLEFAAQRTGSIPMLQMCIEIVSGHHEKYDGTGYPQQLRGEEIPLAARIVALADAYDAITSARPYKSAREHAEAVDVILLDSGRHFDPDVVSAFLARADDFNAIRLETQGPGGAPALEPAGSLAGG